jgi:RND family efflux transporter MFP subunit
MMREQRGIQSIIAIIAVILTAWLSSGCTSGRSGETAAVGKPAVAVEAAPVVRADTNESVEVVGTLKPRFAADVKSEFPGTVREVYVTEWVHVVKGTPLAKLDSAEMEAATQAARAAALQAKTALDRATREYERAQKLKEAGLLTQQGLEDAGSLQEASAAAYDAAEAQLRIAETRLSKAVIRAPMSGIVSMRAVSVGDMAGGDPIFRVIDTRAFDLTMTVPSTKIAKVSVGQPVHFTTDALPGKEFRGTVSFINPAAESLSRTIKVVAQVDNRDGLLKADLFCKGGIVVSTRAGVLQAPRAALLSWDVANGKADVFVLNGTTAHRRSVRTGQVLGDRIEILDGVAEGEKLVTRGAFNLDDGDLVTVVDGQEA